MLFVISPPPPIPIQIQGGSYMYGSSERDHVPTQPATAAPKNLVRPSPAGPWWGNVSVEYGTAVLKITEMFAQNRL